MLDLIAPNGVTFSASDEVAPRLLACGWTRVAVTKPRPVDLTALTVAQLRELCDECGIVAPKRTTKAQLVSLLKD